MWLRFCWKTEVKGHRNNNVEQDIQPTLRRRTIINKRPGGAFLKTDS